MLRRSSLVSAVALSGALTLSSALACTVSPPSPPTIQIVQTGPNTYCIFICNYTAAGALVGDFCACALNTLGVISSVDAVQIFQSAPPPAGTGEPDPCNPGRLLSPVPSGWEFETNLNTGIDFQNEAGTGFWVGFFASTVQNIPQSVPVTIKFTVTTVAATSTQDLVAAVGSGALFVGVGKSDPAGNLMPAHTSINPAGDVFLNGMAIPALGVVGLALCGTGLAAVGAVAIRRRNRLA